MKRFLWVFLSLTLLMSCLTGTVLAANQLVVDDQAMLLNPLEAMQLQADYAGITEYFDVAFVTTNSVSGSTASYAERYAINHYGNDPAVMFFIDMDNRNIYVYANGDALKTISEADARAITDNIYKYASRGDYYGCADAAFSQILAKCQGQKLARPVKHITNAMIAVLFGILLNYWITARSRRPKKGKRTNGVEAVTASRQMAVMPAIAMATPVVIASVQHYKDDDSGSGGGGGGGGGGGHSGGGGGHSF